MICHLNQQAFQKYGTILPERQERTGLSGRAGKPSILTLTRENAPVFLCREHCWVCPEEKATVLSVSVEGLRFEQFYLDKPVRIHPGITFMLFPLGNDSTAELASAAEPALLEYRKATEELRILPTLRAESLYTLFYHEKEQGFIFPGEAHPMLELTYVDQGTVHSVADGVDLLLEQGEMALYAPNQWHMQYADMGVAPRYMSISFEASGQLPPTLFNRKLKAPQKVLALLNQMLQEYERAEDYAGDMILSLLNQLLILLHRSADAAPEKLKASHAILNENEIIRRAQQYISGHVRQKLTVPVVARQVDVSPSYLTALFHKHLQIAPGEYIRRIKLQESKQMIRENAMNFTQIAAALQYSTVHHFSRQFKEKYGITPSEYAKSVR